MKKLNFYIFITLLLSSTYTTAQEIPNGGFETWTSTSYFEEPEPFTTSNSLSYMMGDTVTVSKSTDHYTGNYSARLETLALGPDTVPGLIMIGELSGENIIGGVPFNDRPDSLAGYVKYNLVGGDEFYIICLFTRQGLPIGSVEATYSGTQSNFTRISMPVSWFIPFLNPDSLKIVIANTSELVTGNAGSTVYLDHFQFIGTTLPFPNGEFEDWTMLSGQEPDSWTTLNYLTSTSGSPYATKTNDHHGGSWALRIENINSFIGETIGYLTNGDFQGFSWTGGLAVDANPSLLSGYYKYLPEGNDTAQAGVFSYFYDASGDSNIVLEEKIIKLPPANTYTYFEVSLEYNSNPPVDTVNLAFSAGSIETGLVEGSVLFLDDIDIEYYPVSVSGPDAINNGFTVYPNPCTDHINIKRSNSPTRNYTFCLFDTLGQEVLSVSLLADPVVNLRIHLPNLNSGLYFFRITGFDEKFTGKIIVQ